MSNKNNVWTLEAMEEELEREYAPLTFRANGTDFVLVSLLRLSKDDRQQVETQLGLIDTSDEADVDEDQVVESIEFVLTKVTQHGKGRELVELLGHDLLRLMKMMGKWTEATQPGEASDSQS